MDYYLENAHLTVRISSLGAQLQQIINADGTEYLWYGDPTYWGGRSPILFPFVGRLKDCQYLLNGVKYPLEIHGFARKCDFSVCHATKTQLDFLLVSNDVTQAVYPYDFQLHILYTLLDDTLGITYLVQNNSKTTMYFGLGAHPGFRVPLDRGKTFEDYRIELLGQAGTPMRVGFSADCLINGNDEPYLLNADAALPLRHTLFDNDAIFLSNVAKQARLTAGDGHSITLFYPDMTYLGIWHTPKTKAPFVCIEPWTSLPGRHDIVEDFATMPSLIHLPAQQSKTFCWSMTFA